MSKEMSKKQILRWLDSTEAARGLADAGHRNLFEWMLWNTELTPNEICEISNRPRP